MKSMITRTSRMASILVSIAAVLALTPASSPAKTNSYAIDGRELEEGDFAIHETVDDALPSEVRPLAESIVAPVCGSA